MKTGTTNIKLNYKPLNATKSIRVLSGSERQNYNADTMTFEPDRRIDPLVIMVECGVTDPHNLKNGNVIEDLNSVSWKISENGVFKDILESDSDFNIGKNANKGQLTIYKNISDLEPVTIIFTAKYLEPISKRVVNFQENFDLITLPIAQTPLTLEATMPVGGTLFVNKNQDGLLTQAKLFRGIEQIPAAYYWYKGSTEITDTNGYVGSKTERLFIPSSDISKTGDVVRVEVADCSDYVNQLVNQKVDTDTDVVRLSNLYKNQPNNLLISSEFRELREAPSNSAYISYSLESIINEPTEVTLILKYTYVKGGSQVITIAPRGGAQGTGATLTVPSPDTSGTTSLRLTLNETTDKIYIYVGKAGETINNGIILENVMLFVGNNESASWALSKTDLQTLVNTKKDYYESITTLPENYRPATKPAKTYKADYLLIKKFPEYQEEVLITQGGIDPSVSSVEAEMIIKTNDGVLQNPENYFSVGWLKQTNGTFKYRGFKVNISMADIVALNAENKELDYELREDLTLKV